MTGQGGGAVPASKVNAASSPNEATGRPFSRLPEESEWYGAGPMCRPGVRGCVTPLLLPPLRRRARGPAAIVVEAAALLRPGRSVVGREHGLVFLRWDRREDIV